MQDHIRSTALLLTLAFSASTTLIPEWTHATPQDPAAVHDDEHSALGNAMSNMNDALRSLRDGIEAEDAATALAALAEFQTNVIAAKAEAPPNAVKLPEAERSVFVGAFRTTLIDVLRVSCDLEVALIEGRFKDAKALLKENLDPLADAGHNRFDGDD